MAFRDDHQAALERARILQQELDSLRHADARADELERRLQSINEELAEAQGEIAKLRTKERRARDPNGPRNQYAIAGAVTAVALAGGAFFAVSSPREPPSLPALTVPEPLAAGRMAAEATPAETATPDPLQLAGPPPVDATLTWAGSVEKAEGIALVPGSACSLKVKASTAGYQGGVLKCGDELLYDSSHELNGMSQHNSGLGEVAAPTTSAGIANAFGYIVEVDDVGQRSGARSQITLNSNLEQAVVFRETVPVWRVEVKLAKLANETRSTSLYSRAAVSFDAVTRTGAVSKALGNATAKPGDSCAANLQVSFLNRKNAGCHLTLRCNDHAVYDGYSPCALEAQSGLPWLFVDSAGVSQDQDARVTLDLHKGTATVDDGTSFELTF